MKLLEKLLGHEPPPPPRDPLNELIEVAQKQHEDAWEEINRSRLRRGEPPLAPPTWESELQQPDNGSPR